MYGYASADNLRFDATGVTWVVNITDVDDKLIHEHRFYDATEQNVRELRDIAVL